jgi:NAD dependent epimerase/dehydratase
MNWNGKKVLVTGSDGFIGSHLVERLVGLGANVRALVLYNSFNSWGWLDTLDRKKLENAEVIAGDIRDPHHVQEMVKDIEIVFHLASLIAIPYSYHSPDSYLETNVKGTLNLLQAARNSSVGRIIHTSTSEVYGTAQFVPITEEHPLVGQSPYAASKIAADQFAGSFYRSFDLPVTIIRPFNTYGPRQSARAIIPTVISQALSGKKIISIGNVRPTRDFTFVSDTVEGFIKAAEHEEAIGKTLNLGSNSEISIDALVEKIRSLMNNSFDIALDKDRLRPEKSEVDRLWSDNSKAKAILKWGPTVPLEKGLELTLEWFRKNRHLYKENLYNI